jgi:tetratricopeptide (TPR) repeat protein
MKTKALLAGMLACMVFAGCETEQVTHVRVRDPLADQVGGDAPRVTRESKLKDRIEKDPKDVQGWFELGEYYETGMQRIEAAKCYETGNALLTPGRFTGGEYLLARIYLQLQDWETSIYHCNRVFQLEPKDPKSACLNPHFREAHLIRGAIFYVNKQWKPAKKEFYRFLELGGEEFRVEDKLEEIQAQGE